VVNNIKVLEKKINEIMKEKDLDLGKQRKILHELAESQKKDNEINDLLTSLENKKKSLKDEIIEEEEKTKQTDAKLRKQYEEMNIRNNNIANDLQVLRRNLANLNEQLDFAKETEKQFEMDFNVQETEYKTIQQEISDLEVLIRDIKEKRVDKAMNEKVESELKILNKELEQYDTKHMEINSKNSKIEIETK